jgi:hypothetical protein
MVSGQRSKTQFVFEIVLDQTWADPREGIRRATCDLMPGRIVRIYVGDVGPIGFGVPFVTRADFDWYRRDLNIQFCGSNTNRLDEWENLVLEIEGRI